jgi:hypothetical protein
VRVDDPAVLWHFEPLTGDARDEVPAAEVLAAGKELDLARLLHPVGEDATVVGTDL